MSHELAKHELAKHEPTQIQQVLSTGTTPSASEYVHGSEADFNAQTQDQFLSGLIEMRLHSLSFPAFQQLVRLVLFRSGYSSVRTCGEGQDRKTWGEGGLELLALAHTDLSTSLTAVQLKLHRQLVPRRCVDELRGVMERIRADAGLMVSVAPFSALTQKLAARSDLPPVKLIDSKRLTALLLKLGLGTRTIPQSSSPQSRSSQSTSPGVRQVFDAEFFNQLEERAQKKDEGSRESGAA